MEWTLDRVILAPAGALAEIRKLTAERDLAVSLIVEMVAAERSAEPNEAKAAALKEIGE